MGVLDAGHSLWTREWDPRMKEAPGGFEDGGKEALNAGFQRPVMRDHSQAANAGDAWLV